MSILTDDLPTELNGLEIATDFRAMLRYESLLFAPDIPAGVKMTRILALFYPKGYGKMAAKDAWEGLQWFHRCGRQEQKARIEISRMAARAYDWEQDAPLILAAFQQAYGLDLTVERIHWWRFRALFDHLPADCRLCKIMEYRVADTGDMPERTRAFYERMRRIYSLDRVVTPDRPMTLEEHDAAFIARLRHE